MRFSAIQKSITILLLATWLSMAAALSATAQPGKWLPFEESLSAAKATNRLIVIHVWAPWCGWCLKMKRDVYPLLDPGLADNFVFTRLNWDDNETRVGFAGRNKTPLQLAQNFGVQEIPATVILNTEGKKLLHFSGFMGAGNLQNLLIQIAERQQGPVRR